MRTFQPNAQDHLAQLRSLPLGFVTAASALLFCLLLVGCASQKQEISYYQPQPVLGMEVTASAGPDNEARFELKDHGVRLMVIAQASYDPARIWMSVHLPAGATLRIKGDHFTIRSLKNSTTHQAPVAQIRGTYQVDGEGIYRDFNVGDLLEGASDPSYTRFWGKPTTIPRHFEITAPLSAQLPESFELQLPEMELSGKPLNLPPLYFNHVTGTFKVKENSNHRPW